MSIPLETVQAEFEVRPKALARRDVFLNSATLTVSEETQHLRASVCFSSVLTHKPYEATLCILLSHGLKVSPRVTVKEREGTDQLSSNGRCTLDLKETLLEHCLFSIFFNDIKEGIPLRKWMAFADDTVKDTKTQIRKTYIRLKHFHLEADNRIRFILEKCRPIVTIHLGGKNLQCRYSASE